MIANFLKFYARATLGGMLVGVLLGLTACGGGDEDAGSIPAPSDVSLTDASGRPLVLDVEELKIDNLIANTNRVVANNAVQLKAAMQAKDYTRASIALTAIAGSRLDSTSEAIVRDALHKLVEVVDAAVANGDENAKFAQTHLQQIFSQ